MGERSCCVEHVSALVFRVMGVAIGLDTDQLNGMSDARTLGEEGFELVAIETLLGLGNRGPKVEDGVRPKVLFVKGGYSRTPLDRENTRMQEERSIGLVVNEPEEIIDIPVSAMRPMPKLVAPHGDLNGFWAVALMQHEMIFMMDVRKMIGSKMPGVRWTDEGQVAGT
jgi:hypothetical protein